MDMNILAEFRESIKDISYKTFMADGGNLFPLDLMAMGIAKRSVLLISGFIGLIENDNFLSAVSLIRLHLDSLLQFYGAFIVKEPHEYANYKLKGHDTKKYKDKRGERMSDNRIKKVFFADPNNQIFLSLSGVYKETSRFIHFSDKHIFMAISKMKGNNFEISINDKLDVGESKKKEAIQCMCDITGGILFYLNSWCHTKDNSGKNR